MTCVRMHAQTYARTHASMRLRMHLYTKQLRKVLKNSLEGWSAHTTNLPMAKASADVVHTTSDNEGFMNTLYGCVLGSA